MRWCVTIAYIAMGSTALAAPTLWPTGEGDGIAISSELESCLAQKKVPEDCIGSTVQQCQYSTGACFHQEMLGWSYLGNKLYQRLVSSKPTVNPLLQQTQHAWMEYMNKQCQLSYQLDEYSMATKSPGLEWKAYSGCQMERTAKRALYLLKYVKQLHD